MIERLAREMTCYYRDKSLLERGKESIYIYGFELLISTVFNLSAIFIISWFFKKTYETFIFLAAFIPLRLAAGGYHARHHWSCILGFNIIFCLMLLLHQCLASTLIPIYSLCSSVASSIIIYFLAPVAAKNKPLSRMQYQRQRKRSIILSNANLVIAFVFYLIPNLPMTQQAYYSSGTLCVAFLLIAEKISYQ